MYTDDQILKEILRVAALIGKDSVRKVDFQKHGIISISTVKYHFGTWNRAVESAGLTPIDPVEIARSQPSLSEEELLLDLIRIYNETGRPPTEAMINAKGKFSKTPYRKRWGGHTNAFAIARKRFPDKFKEHASQPSKNEPCVGDIKIVPETIKPKNVRKRRVVFGEPIDFRGLRFAPVNEQGVVYLFGMISHELGYLIESVRTEFPDCEGKRCFDKEKNQWEHVRIEFEYKSSNFKEHGHNENDCDVIVCWIHDWDQSPVEVLELRSIINYL